MRAWAQSSLHFWARVALTTPRSARPPRLRIAWPARPPRACDVRFGSIRASMAARTLAAVAASVPNAPVKLAYGTAGFRARAELLDAVFLRMGMLAALRAVQTKKARDVAANVRGARIATIATRQSPTLCR